MVKTPDRTIRFRFALDIEGRESIRFGHEIRATVMPDGRWEVRNPAGLYAGIGRHDLLDLAVLDYCRKVLAGEGD